jgi:hypothetical protein
MALQPLVMFAFVCVKVKVQEWPLSVMITHYDSEQNQPVSFKSKGECKLFSEVNA